MAYLDKLVKQERTGSNIAGINVDTSVANMINPVNVTGNPVRATGTMPTYKIEIFDTIEKYAQEADKAKIANAKVKLSLDLEQARLDLEEKWSTVNDRFTNEDRYNEFLQAKKDLFSEQEKIISSFKYMNKDEKVLALEKNKINYREDYIKTQGTRNSIYTQQQIDNADANIKQLISLSSNLGIHDDKKAKEYLKMIADTVAVKKELAGLTDDQAIVMIANYTKNAEMGRFQNHLEEIKMSDMSYQQKELKLKQIKQAISNKDLMRANIKEIVEMFPVENKEQAEEYLLTEMTDLTSKMVNGYYSEMRAINRAEQRAIAAEARENARIEKANRDAMLSFRNDIINSGNYGSAEKYVYKDTKGLTFGERIETEIEAKKSGNIANSTFARIMGKTISEVVENEEYVIGFVPDTIKNNMSVDVYNLMSNGMGETEALITVASNYSKGDNDLSSLIINDLTQDGGYSQSIDIALKAQKGYTKESMQYEEIKIIELNNSYSPKLSTDEITVLMNNYTNIKPLAEKLVKKGVQVEKANRVATEYLIGSMSKINATSKNISAKDVDPQLIYLPEKAGGITKKEKNKAISELSKKLNDENFINALSSTAKPTKRLKSASINGI